MSYVPPEQSGQASSGPESWAPPDDGAATEQSTTEWASSYEPPAAPDPAAQPAQPYGSGGSDPYGAPVTDPYAAPPTQPYGAPPQPPPYGAPPAYGAAPPPYGAPPPPYGAPPGAPYGSPYGAPPGPPPYGGYPAAPGYGQQMQFGGGTVPGGTNGLAIASLVLGILWVFWLGSVLAIIFGFVAIRQIDATGRVQQGRGLAIAGIVLGFIGVAILVISLIFGAVHGNSCVGTNCTN